MENELDEVDANPHNRNRVQISITRASPSFSEEEEDETELSPVSRKRADSDSSKLIDKNEMEKMIQEDENNENEQLQNGGGGSEGQTNGSSSEDVAKDSRRRTAEDEEVSKLLENGVTLSENGDSASERRESVERTYGESSESPQSKNMEDSQESPEKSPAMEMIGDRVLIERDGKFELVDVSEIKAEYYDMLGISPDMAKTKDAGKADSEGTAVETSENNAKDIAEEKPETRPRPKTTSGEELHRRNEKKRTTRGSGRTRSQSANAKAVQQRNDEYSHIRSEYAMTEQQLEIRRKCREAKLRREKEEEEREREEQERKKEDADRAFQAWLYAKVEAARQARLNKQDPNAEKQIKEERQKDADNAYHEWLEQKRKQDKSFREVEDRRRAEEASQYAIRDRQLCDEAFKRWLKKKKQDEAVKNAAKKKKKPKLKRKEKLPLNSHKNRYYEYYGYRNSVVL